MNAPERDGVLVLTAILSSTLSQVTDELAARHDINAEVQAASSHLEQLGCSLVLQARALQSLIAAYERTVQASASRQPRSR